MDSLSQVSFRSRTTIVTINNSLATSFKIIPLKCKAEMLAVEIVLENKFLEVLSPVKVTYIITV